MELLDQRLLPHEQRYIHCTSAAHVAEAIASMVVRGAPAIGIAAAYGGVLSIRARLSGAFRAEGGDYLRAIENDLNTLAASRPTAVNLMWAVAQIRQCLQQPPDDWAAAALETALKIHVDEIHANEAMARHGAALIEPGSAVLTHCNAGALATGGIGTALGVIRVAHQQQRIHMVYADETRPWLQGSRLTAWELSQDQVPVTVIADGAAAHLMKSGKIHWLIVGSDRIMANGDVANKIGTYHAAIAARHHGVKVMVAAPMSTVDWSLENGAQVEIEQRDPGELLNCNGQPISSAGTKAWNPVFDVTPHELVDVIVTEKGVVHQPDRETMLSLR